jgi:3-phenylpropionate/cinnamic acid dioxygenase small subunit
MEARLIDEDKLEEWLTLFTADGIYSIPSEEHADPEAETSIMYDDANQREKRVYQLRQKHLAQDPRSRTIHYISNVEVEETGPGEADVRCNVMIVEMRPGDHQMLQPGLAEPRSFAARCRYRLRREQEVWRIAHKQVVLINRDLPLQNISFIL